ncbi:pyruvate kinase [Galactobacter valiniphilus]|uniref:Pyruvate kinase n=1 Tax=Galactobacter valiniphilus TaxID=2676122 RepID=A0A399J831_9MICC|nr:pyruvate kinase [Galactobacter valiniphilus]RII41715.1 pyruvate kinase [Galactobacter valiniphilus]
MRRAKIVVTFGPAIATLDKAREAIEAGMDVARLNMSHGDHATHANILANLRQASSDLGKAIGVFADLQGPKIRLEKFADGPHVLAEGDRFTITTRDVPGNAQECGTTFKGLPGDVAAGDTLLINDGKVRLRALAVTDTDVITEVVVGGEVSDHKGINLPGVAVNVPALSDKDEDDLRWALRAGVDMVALSFVRRADDIDRVHQIMDEEGRRVPVIAKIEKPQAVEALEEIIDAFDAIMVARGDLGVELPLEDVPIVQKRAVELARRWAKPVIVATQVLESMIESPTPTRAETSDCANAVLDGADAVMLSGETSVGKYAIGAIKTMARIISSTEEHGLTRIPALLARPRTRGGAVTRAAVEVAQEVGAKYIVGFTQTGDSARRLSRMRPATPMFGFTSNKQTVNYMCLFWGITPKLVEFVDHTDKMSQQVEELLLADGLVENDDLVLVVSGSPPGKAGSTNSLRVHRIGDILEGGPAGERNETRHEEIRPWRTREQAAEDIVRRMNEG